MLITSDFDGTISRADGLKMILDHFVGPEWRPLEEAMKNGDLPERQGLRVCMSLLKASHDEVLQFLLSNLKLDSSFPHFVQWAQSAGHRLVILSSGFEEFIGPVLARDGLEGIEVWANSVVWDGESWNVRERSGPRLCEAQSHCKCSSILKLKRSDDQVVFIGDGHSDRCAVKKADHVFAKTWLADFCSQEQIQYRPYRNFVDVARQLRESTVVKQSRIKSDIRIPSRHG